MALDPAMKDAIKEAVKEAGQPTSVASRLIAWLSHMSDGDVSREGFSTFYENLMEVLEVGEPVGED